MEENTRTPKVDVDFWLKQFRAGTIANEVQTNRDAAYKFFGAFAVMRGNIFELWRILFARRISSLEDEELRREIEELRHEPERSGSRVVANLRENKPGYLTGSLNPWQLACARVYDPGYGIDECMKDLRAWAALVLRSAVG